MISYRTFRNTDPPAIAAIWQSRAGQRGLVQPVSCDLLEQLVFAKLYFDYRGLIIAWEEGRPVGFAHAGFAPNETRSGLCISQGIICLVLVRPDCAEMEIACGLLQRCEQYLLSKGAAELWGGSSGIRSPFYLGLYGGSSVPGVLDTDVVARRAFAARGYVEKERTVILERDLASFEPAVDRRQMAIRRQMLVEVTSDAPTSSWWEASLYGNFELKRFEAVTRNSRATAGWAVFRSMEAVGTSGVARGAGLLELYVNEQYRRRGVAVFLLTEAFRQFYREGVAVIETQTSQENLAGLALLNKLGFRQIGVGSVFRK